MARKTKSEVVEEDKVHVDFVGDPALFIRRIAHATGRSNSETGNMLIQLLQNMEQKITLELRPGAEIPGKNGKPSVSFTQTQQTTIQIDLGEL